MVAVIGLSGCETPGQTALAGAATGAAIGGLLHGRGEDALKGAAIGAGAGYLAGPWRATSANRPTGKAMKMRATTKATGRIAASTAMETATNITSEITAGVITWIEMRLFCRRSRHLIGPMGRMSPIGPI